MNHIDFLLIVTPEWTRLENITDFVYAYGEESLQADINIGLWGAIEGALEGAGRVFPGKTLAEAKLFSFGADPQTRLQMWVLLVPTVYG